MKVFLAPRTTALLWWIISSMVTETVSSYPRTTMPRESPTRMSSMSVWSTSTPVE